MNELSNEHPTPENSFDDTGERPSSCIMMTTILLLIAGLLLASTMMVYYAFDARPSDRSESSLSSWIEKGKGLMKNPETTPEPEKIEAVVAAEPEPRQESPIINRLLPNLNKIRWPRLKLTGFGSASDGSESFAIINGHQVHPGETIDKVTLVEIRSHDVLVEYQGEQKTLAVDIRD